MLHTPILGFRLLTFRLRGQPFQEDHAVCRQTISRQSLVNTKIAQFIAVVILPSKREKNPGQESLNILYPPKYYTSSERGQSRASRGAVCGTRCGTQLTAIRPATPSTTRGNRETLAGARDLADVNPPGLGSVMHKVPRRVWLGPNLGGVIVVLAAVLNDSLGIKFRSMAVMPIIGCNDAAMHVVHNTSMTCCF
jgi:hypothetical protein